MIDKLHIQMLFILLFSVNVFANIQIGTPDNLTECFQSPTEGFDLTINDENVLDGLSPDLYTVYYFDNQADSNNNQIANAISNPSNYSTGSFGLGQVWVNVVENADETNFDNSTFLLNSNQEPFAINPGTSGISGDNHFNVCDADDTFDLTTFDQTVIGQQNGNLIVSYFENQTDANNNQNAIADPANYSLQPDNGPIQTFPIVVRIEFNDSTDCFDTASFDLNTYHKDENDVTISDLILCSSSSGNVVYDLDDAFTQNNEELEIQLFTSPTIIDDGDNNFVSGPFGSQGTVNTYNPILAQFNYTIVMPSGFLSENCPFEETFNVFPRQTPQIESIEDLISCSSGDEEITFDLTQNDSLALGNQTGDFSISYHFTLPEANEGINSVTDLGFDPTEFTLENFQQFLFLRIENVEEPSCFSVDFFTLQDAGNLTAFAPENTQFCALPGDDNLEIDLTQFDEAIKGDQMDDDLIVEYFDNDILIDDPSDFSLENEITNITAVLSLSDQEDCSDEIEFDIILNQTPEIQNLNDLEVCSDFDFTATFDLTENIPQAIGTQDETAIEVSFFTSLADAENNENSLAEQEIDTTEYPVFAEQETIFIRLQNQNSADCFTVDSFELQSFPTEINEVEDLVECTEEGVSSAIFDLIQIETDLFPDEADTSDFSIAYFDENDDEITNVEAYEITSAESVLVEITNLNNSDCVASTTFNLSFNVTPEIQNLNDLEVCSDFDLTATFDLTENISEAIGTQDETEIEVSFFTSLADAENNENSLAEQEIDATEYPVFAEMETIFIRLQNQDATDCFVVDSFELLSFPTEINGVGDLEECFDPETQSASFNLEEIIAELLGENQSLENYEIIFFNQAGSEILATDNYEISVSEQITAEVFNLNNTNCSLSQEINLVVLDEDDPECSLRVQEEVFSGLSIYPNPTSGRVFVEHKQPIQKIEILDIQGKLIKSIQGDNIREIQLNGYAGGMYFLRISKNNVQHLEKIIKN
ncbi:MAG: T9SS type A sorting domain-containing protein [Flavobacteriaceae bacterium]|nr:T9SS type A sorting domain-containing protein [Flavobacteriaceae bacterium]